MKKSIKFSAGNAKKVVTSALGKLKINYYASGETMDYNCFNFFKGNRKPKQGNVNKLIDSIKTVGVLRYVIVCNTGIFDDGFKKTYIIDGQHLFLACKALGIPVRFLMIDGIESYSELIKITSKLNSTGVKWGLDTYIEAYAKEKKTYRTLQTLKRTQNITYSVLLPLLTGKSLTMAKKDVYDGVFSCPKIDQATNFLSNRALVNQYLKGGRYLDEGLLTFAMRSTKPINFVLLLNQMQAEQHNLQRLPTFGKRDEVEQLFQELYKRAQKKHLALAS